MITFTKSIELIQTENFTPQMGTFTLLDGSTSITDVNGVVTEYLKLQFELLQNHVSGNKTIRTGIANIPKAMFDTLQLTYDGVITNTAACKALLQNFNINDLSD